MNRRLFLISSAASLNLDWAVAAVMDLTASEIMQKNFYASKWKALQYESSMSLINERGQQRERRSLNLISLQSNGIDSKFLVKFTSPNDIKGTGFLQIEHSDGDDDLWIYLPALKKSRRLVANNKKDSFVGSDFAYGDILLPKVSAYKHSIVHSEAVDGRDCYVIESLPLSEAVKIGSGYGKKLSWIQKDNFLEIKVEYYDLTSQLLKTQILTSQQQVDARNDRWFALNREMSNHQSGHRTVLRFQHVEASTGLPDELFSMRNLERE